MTMVNRQVRLAARPVGDPKPADWSYTDGPVEDPAEGEFVVEVEFVSLDPAMRGWMDDRPSYLPPVGLGEVMRSAGAGRVIASRHPDFAEGDAVTGSFGVQRYAHSDGQGVVRVDLSRAPLKTHLGALGMTGMTAYFGLLDVGRAGSGDVVVVSGAAGAVGSVAGQIARIKGCHVIGIAGGERKCRWIVDELGFDAAIDYKRGDVASALRKEAGVDVFFDNVGGEVLDAVLQRLSQRARVVLCGGISQYNQAGPSHGPSNYLSLVVRRARMEGFIVFDYAARYGEAASEMAGWILDGRLRTREQIVSGGLKAFPEALGMLFRGENTGKLLLEIGDD